MVCNYVCIISFDAGTLRQLIANPDQIKLT